MKLTDHFFLQEFVPPEIYSVYGVNSQWFIDRGLVLSVEQLRVDLAKPITINNWHTGGSYKNSGFRTPDVTVGGKLSQHRFGRAMDLKIHGMHPEEVRAYLRIYFEKYGITTIEKDTPTWVHIDKRYTGLNFLLEVNYR
jgi:hypothetical protein